MKPRVYVETSVISYLTAWSSRDLIIAANQQITQEWWKSKREKFDLYVSQLVIQEAERGDERAAKDRLDAIANIPPLELNDEALQLGEILIDKNALPKKAAEDALHIAIATVNGMDYLLTWNFKHIANATMRGRVEQVCRDEGYDPAIICSPQELQEI